MPALSSQMLSCVLVVAVQSPQPAAEPQERAEQSRPQQAEPNPDLAVQIQRLLDYLEHRVPRNDQSPRVGEIGAQASRRPDRILSRIYDIGDLFIPAPAYAARYAGDWDDPTRVFPELALALTPAPSVRQVATTTGTPNRLQALLQLGGGMGGIGGISSRASGSGTPEARPDLDELIGAITSSIAPNSWSSVGGENTITTLGTVLLVSAPEDVQRQVDQFLRLLRQLWGTSRTVRVHAYWLWLSDDEVAALFPEGSTLAGAVDRRAWNALGERLGQANGRPDGYRAHLACFDGQTVFVTAGDRRLSLSGLKPVIAAKAVAYTPEVRVLHQGAVLQITPTATNEAKAVILDVHSRVTELRDTDAGESDRATASTGSSETARFAAGLRDTRLEEHHLASTLLVPLRTIVLVGGMSGTSAHAPNRLYLFVEVAVQEPQLKDEGGRMKEE